MQKFTVFCQQADGKGTIWIDSFDALEMEDAKRIARATCASDWAAEEEDIHVLGVAAGDVEILEWEDICQ